MNKIAIELICFGYLASYIVLSATLFPSNLWLATIINCMMVKTLYLSAAALGTLNQDSPLKPFLMLNMVLMLSTIMFGTLVDSIALSALAEILLFQIQYKVVQQENMPWLFALFLVCPEIMPISWVALRVENIASLVNTVGVSVAFSKYETAEVEALSLGKQ